MLTGLRLTVGLTLIAISGCGGAAIAVPTPATVKESPPDYNFAVAETHKNADVIEAMRATITWWVRPVTQSNSAQSTWIGIFGATDPTLHLSLRIAQIGWKQQGGSAVRIFWEWGEGSPHSHITYGDALDAGVPLSVEIDRDSRGTFSFVANGVLLGSTSPSWTPTYIAVGSETHHPADLMAGSESMPEVIANLEWKLNGTWQAFDTNASSTYTPYKIRSDPEALRIWDVRQR